MIIPNSFYALQEEIVRLKKISERQSAMLAAALKEKNELAGRVTAANEAYYIGQIKRLQLDLSKTQENFHKLKTIGKDFLEALTR